MLQSLHDKLKGWASALIIGVISVVFVLWGISYYFEGNNQRGQTVAKVGEDNITDYQVQQQLNQIRQELSSKGVTDLNNPKYQKIALSQLVNQALQKAGALKMGLMVSQALVDREITQMPYFQTDNQFSQEKYEQFLNATGYTLPILRSILEANMLSSQVTIGLLGSDFILPGEESQTFDLLFQKRKVKYAIIPYVKLTAPIKISQTEINDYYKDHQNEFLKPSMLSVKYIKLTLADVAKKITVTDGQIKAYYDQNKTKWQTKDKNGKEVVKPLALVKSQIENTLKDEQAKVLYSSIGNQMANLAYQYPDSLEKAAQKANVSIKKSSSFTKESGTGIASNKQVREVAFSDNVLKNKYNSDVINISPTEAVIIRVNQYVPQKEKPLAEVSSTIKDILIQNKQQQKVSLGARSEIEVLNSGKSIKTVLGIPVVWNESVISRDDEQLPKDIIDSMMAVDVNQNFQSTYQMAAGKTALYIYHVENVIQPNKSVDNYYQMQIQSETMSKNLLLSLQYEAYLNYLKELIPVTINKSNE